MVLSSSSAADAESLGHSVFLTKVRYGEAATHKWKRTYSANGCYLMFQRLYSLVENSLSRIVWRSRRNLSGYRRLFGRRLAVGRRRFTFHDDGRVCTVRG